MSSLLHPVGHLPASAYWVRRVLVLAVLTALVVMLFRVFGIDDPKSTAAPGLAVSPSAGPSGSPPPSGSPSTPVESSTPVDDDPVEDKDGRCSGADVHIAVAPAARIMPAGRPLNLQVRMSAINSTCTASIDPERLVVTISSGRDRIWTTEHCTRTVARATLVLAAGRDSTTTVGWDGRRSAPNCAQGQQSAKPGTYVVEGRYDGHASAPQAFYLT